MRDDKRNHRDLRGLRQVKPKERNKRRSQCRLFQQTPTAIRIKNYGTHSPHRGMIKHDSEWTSLIGGVGHEKRRSSVLLSSSMDMDFFRSWPEDVLFVLVDMKTTVANFVIFLGFLWFLPDACDKLLGPWDLNRLPEDWRLKVGAFMRCTLCLLFITLYIFEEKKIPKRI